MYKESPIVTIQKWLMQEGKCVSCGKSLFHRKKEKKNGYYMITCDCKRVYIWEYKINLMRRANYEDFKFFVQ